MIWKLLRFHDSLLFGSCRARSVYLTTSLLGRLSPLSGLPVLCTFFRQKLTTALLDQRKAENDHRKYLMINLHKRMSPTSAGVEPTTSWSPVGRRIQLSHRGRPAHCKSTSRIIRIILHVHQIISCLPVSHDHNLGLAILKLAFGHMCVRSAEAQISDAQPDQGLHCPLTECINGEQRQEWDLAHVQDDVNPHTLQMFEGTFLLDTASI